MAEEPQNASANSARPHAAETGAKERRPKPFKWTFPRALLAILVLTHVGQLALTVGADHWRVLRTLRETMGLGEALAAWPAASVRFNYTEGGNLTRDFLFAAFAVSFAVFLWGRRDQVVRFFRSMVAGVSVVLLSTLAVAAGVLVPKIDPVDDPDVRVGAPGAPGSDYEEHYEQFQWAVGYFLYHLTHLYGVGMPDVEIPEVALSALDEYGRRYGFEEAANRRKGMQAAFSGNAKTEEIYQFATENDRALRWWFDLSTHLHLNRIYRSFWFASLMTILAVAIAFNTFHGGPKRWFTVAKFGFFVVHVGMLVMLAGGALSRTFTTRGILHLHKDGLDLDGNGVYLRERGEIPPVEDAFFKSYISDSAHLRYLPFGLSLEHFARRDWPAVEVTFLDQDARPLDFKSRLPAYTLWNGRSIDLDYRETEDGKLEPRLRLVVKQLHDRASADGVEARERTPEERGDAPPRPVAQFRLPDMARLAELSARGQLPSDLAQVPQVTRFLPAAEPGAPVEVSHYDEFRRFRLAVAHGGDPRSRFPKDDGVLGRCYVRAVVGGVEVDEVVDVRLGEFVELPGGYRVVFQRATKAFRTDPQTGEEITARVPLAEQFPVNPAVFAHLVGPDGTAEDRVLIDRQDPVARGLTATYTFEDLILSLEWDDWTSPGPPRWVLSWESKDRVLLWPQEGEPIEVAPGPGTLPLDGVPIGLEAVFDDVSVSPRIEFVDDEDDSDRWNADFYSRDPRGLELEVVTWPEDPERRRSEVVRMATTQNNGASFWVAEDRSFVLTFFLNTRGFPFEWRSVLRVHERDGSGNWQEVDLGAEYEREIRVNDYLYYRGYRMFQTNASDSMPDYSGIGIVYDPGIPLAMGGMYIVIAGAAFAFLVRPVVLARRKRPQVERSA